MLSIILITQLACCLSMTGIIWLVQLVHYPAYHYIAADKFQRYQKFHTKNITKIVLPLMLAELLSAILLAITWWPSFHSLANLAIVILIWLATFLISVPIHQKLNLTYDATLIKKLINTNWIRTILWSLRSLAWLIIAKSLL
jgi:hypothetical protein